MNALMAVVRWIDDNIERVLILIAYSSMALIIVFAVFERFVLQQQIPWSSSIPIYLFLWVTWIGCSYNVKKRSHLVFNDIRMRMPYTLQFGCMILDAVAWLVFSVIVLYFAIDQTLLVKQNWAIVQGTDNIMQWWFYMVTPVAWVLLIIRVIQNLAADIGRYRRKEPFLVEIQAVGQA